MSAAALTAALRSAISVGWRQPVRDHRQRDRPERRDLVPGHRRRDLIVAERHRHLLEVRRLLDEGLVRVLLGGDVELGRRPVDLVAEVLVVVGAAADRGGAGEDRRVGLRRVPGALRRRQAAGGELLVDLLPDARALRGVGRQVQRRRRAGRPQEAGLRVLVGARPERGPLLVVDLVVHHPGQRLARRAPAS